MDLHEKAERLWGVWSVTEVHIGTWTDGKIAHQVHADEYPDGTIMEMVPAASLAEVERERDEWKKWLGELLAVIHRDGGHYLDENGLEVSVRDAHKVWADTMLQLDEARARVAAVVEKAAKMVPPYCQKTLRALARPEETDALDRLLQKARDMTGTDQKCWNRRNDDERSRTRASDDAG